jgi:hypothetical protein
MPKKSGKRKSRKRYRATPGVIVVTLTQEEKDKAMKSIDDQGAVGFEILDIEQKTIPIVRARTHPVQL